MLIGNKQMFYTCKATGKKASQHFHFFLLLTNYNKEELMAYVSSPQNKTTKYMSVFLFFSFAKKQKRKMQVSNFSISLL